jgi:integrase
MAVSKRGRIYHYEFELGGRRYRGSTKRTNRQDALKVEATKRTRLLNSLQDIPHPTAVPTFGEFADQFLTWAKLNLSKANVKLHHVNIERLKQFFRGKLINKIDRKSVEDFKVWRVGQKRENGKGKVSGATVNRNLTTLKRIYNHADAMGLNVRNPVRHVPYFKETGRMRALTLEEVDKYLAAAKGDLKDFAALALDTGARPMELLALHKNDVHLTEGYVSLPGTKNVRARRDVPLTDGAKEVLERRISKSPNGYIFPVRRRKTKHKEVQHITSLKKAHERIIAKYFADDPFTPYTFRHTYGTRHSQAGTELPVLAELMGHAEIQTTMLYVHAARKQKIEATARLQAYVEAARKAKQLQEERKAESWKVPEDEWGNPIYENEPRSPQNPTQEAEPPDLQFLVTRLF